MADDAKTIRIFTMPQQFPCGPTSSCCGPIGQSEEQIENLKGAVEKEFGCRVEVVNLTDWTDMQKHPSVARVVGAFGAMALPIIALDGEVACMGSAMPEEAVEAVKERMKET